MARRIAAPPILYGEDAVRFLNEMRNVKPVSYDEKKRVREAYEMLKNIATFRLQLEFVLYYFPDSKSPMFKSQYCVVEKEPH